MLRRWSQSWCWGLVLLAMLGPAVALACSRSPPQSWKTTTVNGLFELSLELPKDSGTRAVSISLRDVRARKVLWQRSLEDFVYPEELILSTSGRYVALASPYSPTIVIFGPDGTERKRWSLEDHLKKSEVRRIPYSSCGHQWMGQRHFEGEVLVVTVLTGGMVPPMYKQPAGTMVRINAGTGVLTRDAPPPDEGTAKLIQDYRSATDASKRSELAGELLGRSADTGIGGDAGLRRLWQDVLMATDSPPSLVRVAVEGLSLVATDEELRQSARLPQGSPERNESLLAVLEKRLPDEAEAYSLRVLSERWPTELLRQRAVYFLSKRERMVATQALVLGMGDPSGKVRADAIGQMAQPPVSSASIERVLSLCEDPEADVRSQAVESLRRMFRNIGEGERLGSQEVLSRVGAAGKLKCFPEGWVILGAVADVQGDRARALELYTRGLKELKALEEQRRNGSRELVLEATLQLAFEAKKQGKPAEVARWAREVLADERNQREFVCAPKPNPYAGQPPATGCRGRSTAGDTARELLKEEEGQGTRQPRK